MDRAPEERNVPQNEVKERSVAQRIGALILVGIVLFGFLGTCYWLAFYGV